MVSNDLINLIRYIVWYATERDIKLTTVRLVKFLYLADFFNAMYTSGKLLTGCKWYFVNYGPYCGEAMQGIEQAVSKGIISATSYTSKYVGAEEYKVFYCKDEDAEKARNELPDWIFSKLHWAIRKYGEDTAALLDYVYFDTDPMVEARKGDLLDFSKVRPVEKDEVKALAELSQKNIDTAREKIKALANKHKEGRKNLLNDDLRAAEYKDDAYYNFLEYLDRKPLPGGFRGVAKLVD